MRILMVANTLPPNDISGVGEQVLQLAAGLRGHGHEVDVLGRGEGGARGPKVLFPLTVVWPTLRRLRSWRPAVVEVHESDGGLVALAVALARRLGLLDRGLRLVALQQVSYCEERRAVRPLVDRGDGRLLGAPGAVERRFRWLKAPLQIALGRLTARLADLVLAPSAATAAELRRDYGLAVDPGVLPNATGGLAVSPRPSPAGDEAPGYLLFVGRLRIRKGVEVLLHALTLLAAAGHRPRLLIAGAGEHEVALQASTAALELTAQVRYLGKAAPGEVRALLAQAAALVVPSTYEGMPLVVLEAMALGVPVVASAVSGIPEVVCNGGDDPATGWLVPAEDPGALAAALLELFADPGAGRARGDAGRQRVVRYRPEAVAATWLRLVVGGSTEASIH
jgi:glycosyltransferase involved in cell wall biosynthesis